MFRVGNERMHAWPENQETEALGRRLTFFCECGDATCRAHMQLTGAEYEAVRADPTHFAVLPGHIHPEAERVVETHERFVVVRKRKEVRHIAENTDPRRDATGRRDA